MTDNGTRAADWVIPDWPDWNLPAWPELPAAWTIPDWSDWIPPTWPAWPGDWPAVGWAWPEFAGNSGNTARISAQPERPGCLNESIISKSPRL